MLTSCVNDQSVSVQKRSTSWVATLVCNQRKVSLHVVGGLVRCPNPVDFFLWAEMKRVVYESPLDTEEELVARVATAAMVVSETCDIFLTYQTIAGTQMSPLC